MTVRSCHLPRKAESSRKSTATPSSADVENLKKLLQISQHCDRAQAVKFITRCKLLWRRQCHAKPARYKWHTYLKNNRLSVFSSVWEFHAHNLSTYHLSGFFWKKNKFKFRLQWQQDRLGLKQKKHHKYFQYHFLRTTFPTAFPKPEPTTPCPRPVLRRHWWSICFRSLIGFKTRQSNSLHFSVWMNHRL